MSDFKIKVDDATREAAIAAASNPTRDTSIALLATAAAASFGPFAGLAVRYGANLAIDAIAKHRGKKAIEMNEAEIRLAAAELLNVATFEEQAEVARKKAATTAADVDDGDDDGA